jgi:hypothetical protein
MGIRLRRAAAVMNPGINATGVGVLLNESLKELTGVLWRDGQ